MVCVEEALRQLKEKANTESNFDYQIIAKYENLRDVLMFKKANNIQKEIVKPIIGSGDKSVFKDDAFIAVVDENYILHHVFFLDTESKTKLATYLSLIKYSKYLK